MTVVHAKEA